MEALREFVFSAALAAIRVPVRYAGFLLRLILAACLFIALAQAEGLSVNKAEMRRDEDGYRLYANYDAHLTLVVQEALSRGVPLYFVSEFSLTRSRWYWMDEEVFRSEQVSKLSYNMLTRQYRISRGALFQNFASFDEALNMLARQASASIPVDLLKKSSAYTAAVRMRLDTTQLPKLLQVNALTGKDWTLNSDWYHWVVRPSDIVRGESRSE